MRVVVVGPPSAPVARPGRTPRGRAARRLSEQYGATYVRTSDWSLPYLDDRLHLTPAGHRTFGDAVAAADRRQLLTRVRSSHLNRQVG